MIDISPERVDAVVTWALIACLLVAACGFVLASERLVGVVG